MSSNKKSQTFNDLADLAAATGLKASNSPSNMQTPKKIISIKKSHQNMASDSTSAGDQPNIGWMFYKDYFKNVKYGNISYNEAITEKDIKLIKDNDAKLIKEKNQKIINSKWVPVNDGLGDPAQSFLLEVTYPGLVTGIGLSHEAGVEGEFKMGLHFDYTFGQPIIHGSSVKGSLRSIFPKEGKNKQGEDKDKHLHAKLKFFSDTISDKLNKSDELQIRKTIKDIENEIFEGIRTDGSRIDIYHRDVFFDAILNEADEKGRIVEGDSITPHGTNPLKNPNPLPFLKISSGSSIRFRFKLENGILTIDEKIALFMEIFKTIGIGAKTNVGYGQFEP